MSYSSYNDNLPDMNSQADSSGDIVTFVGKLQRVVFPKSPIILGTEGHNRGITGWSVESTIEGSVETNKYGNVSVKGDFYFVLDEKIPYKIMARRVVDPNYGTQYELIYINENQDMSILSNQKAFLKTFLSDNQISELYKVYDNPLDIIANQDKEALKKVKGIGDYISEKIIERYNDKKDWSTVYVEMDHFGLSPGIIEKLKKAYSTPARVLEKLRTNPYSLVYEVEGIGFLTADKIAVKSGLNPKGVKRIKEYIRYYLYEQGSEGNSYVISSELTTAIYNFFEGKENILVVRTDEEGNVVGNNIGDAVNQLVKEGIIGIEDNANRNRRRVYSMKYYNLEKNIAKELHRIMKGSNYFNYSDWQEKIKRIEKEQGFDFTDEQLAGIKLGLDSKVCIITGSAGCVDCDTEFFNGKEWKKISEYTSGDKVLQYNLDGTANLTEPLDYIKLPADYLWHFETKYGLDQTLSEEHRILYITQKGFLHETNIKTIKERQESEGYGWHGKFLTTFKYDGPGINLTDDEIRLMVAVIADGSFTGHSTNYCRFHIKKERKKERLKMLAKKANIEIEERESAAEGYNDYILYAPRKEKEYTEYWYNCSNHQLKIICDEVMYWDGHKSKTKKGVNKASFSTSSKKSADFIQFAFSATENKRASLQTFDRRGQINKKTNKKEYERKSIEYEVVTTNRKHIGICADKRANHKKTKIEQVPTIDGYKYCFTVPSSYLVLRRNNKIFITGNSGKSSLVSGILRSLSNYTFAQCALSGQAAARLQEVTGEDGMTIHRLLGYNPSNAHDEYNGFACNEDCPLEYDIIILDEISMVGGEIFYSLLKAIPDNAKLIMLGDTGQLESVGSLNLAHDMMESGVIPTVKLTKVHRQAQKSGILTSSYDVRNNIQLFPNAFEGTDVRGELQDMFFDVAQRRDDFLEKIIDYFEDIYNGELVNQNIMDIQVLTPVKERGATSVMELNRAIQGIVNPVDPSDDTPKIVVKHKKNDEDRTYYIHTNDKVMCIKNNYKMSDVLGNPAPVYNGWTGIVIDMTEEYVFVKFPFYRHPVMFAMEDARKYLILGYASTVHKCVTGDTLIYTNKGIRKIQDISEEEIGTLKVWNGKYFEAPDRFVVNQPLNTLRVETKRRYSISGLPDHRMFVLGEDGYIIEKELKDLTADDYLVINKNNNCFSQAKEDIHLPKEWFDLPPMYYNTKHYTLPKILDEDFALFLGMMVADGCVSSNKISLGKKEEDYVNIFSSLIKKLFDYEVTPSRTKGEMKIAEVFSIFIFNFCYNIKELRPYQKDIPEIILSAPKNIQAKFLSALFEDGNINIKNGIFDHIELTFKDKNIIDKVRLMLLNFGIITSYLEKDSILKGKRYTQYCLYIYKEDAKSFAKNIGFITKLNKEKIKYCFNDKTKFISSRVSIPKIDKCVLKLMDSGKLKEKSYKMQRIYQKIKERKRITIKTLEEVVLFYEQLNGENDTTRRLKDLVNNYYFDKVEKIEEAGLQSTYCFNMPETHSFVANGYYSLNCQGSGFKAIIGVIDYSTPPSMLTCQLVYTLITRAKKLCILVAQNGALRTAIANNFVSIKRTFLQEFLNAS